MKIQKRFVETAEVTNPKVTCVITGISRKMAGREQAEGIYGTFYSNEGRVEYQASLIYEEGELIHDWISELLDDIRTL